MTCSKSKILKSAFACWALAGALCASASSFIMQSDNITCRNGMALIARKEKMLLDDDFTKESGKWEPFTNFQDLLIATYGEYNGTKGFLITHGPKKETDTAFEVTSKPLPVFGGNEYFLTIAGLSSLNLAVSTPCGENYHTEIKWLDKDSKPLAPTPFTYDFSSKSVKETKIFGYVPKDAAFAVIRMGGDHPNIIGDDYVLYTHVSFESENVSSKYCASGSFVSKPWKISEVGKGSLAWNAKTLNGTSVAFQLSTAPDDKGVPGEWTPFAGPGGKADAVYNVSGKSLPKFPAGHAWIRYRAILTGNGTASPFLRNVKLGAVTDSGWTGVDRSAPEIVRSSVLNPNPMAPVSFQFKDDTAVDWKSVRVKLDEKDITASMVRDGNVLTYSPADPGLTVTPDLFENILCWKVISNLTNYLFIAPLKGEDGVLRITREGKECDTFFKIDSPLYEVTAGTDVTVSIDCRHTLSLIKDVKNNPVKIIWLDAAKAAIGSPVLVPVKNSKEWQTCTATAKAPANTAFARLQLGMDAPNIFFENYIDFRNPSIKGNGVRPVTVEKPNLHTFVIKAADFSGNACERTLFHLVDKPIDKNVVTIRKDGAVLIDGKPFFPIGLYAVWKRDFNHNNFDEAFEGLKKGGFNLAHTYTSARSDEFREFMDAAERHGVKLFIASGKGANCTDANIYLQDVAREYKHPAMLSWYLADDTASHVTAEQVRTLHDAIRDIDTAHITCQADPVGNPTASRYRAYVNSTDCFLPEIYPVRKGADIDKMVPKVIQDMKVIQADLAANGNPPRTIWPIIQYFKGWTSWIRFPTYEELRAMSFLSIIHGGNGITWYTYGGYADNHGCCDTPEVWATMCRVATQLHELEDVFLTECYEKAETPEIVSGPAKDGLGFDSISVLYKRVGKSQFLICANSSVQEVRARLKVKGASNGKVWFEDRSVALKDGAFIDVFAPNDVHVYELTK